MILKTAEPKHRNVTLTKVFDSIAQSGRDPIPNPTRWQLFHNCVTYIGLANNITPDYTAYPFPTRGVEDFDRVGDQINAVGIRVNFVMDVNNQFRSCKFKMFLVEWDKANGEPWITSNLFELTTGIAPLDKFDNDRFRIRPVGVYQLRPHDMQNPEVASIQVSKWIPLKRRLTFTDNTQRIGRGMKDFMGLLIIPFAAMSDSAPLEEGLQVGTINATATLHWKDP